MTIQQIHREVKLFLDKVDSEALPDFLPQEIDLAYHEAEVRKVKFYANQPETQDVADKLAKSYFSTELTLVNREVTLPENYLSYRASRVQVSNARVIPVYTNIYMAPQGKVHAIGSDPYNNKISTPLTYIEDNKYKVYEGDYNVHKVLLTYIKYPTRVNFKEGVGSTLTESLQKECIQLTVNILLETAESQRLQGKVQLDNIT